MPNRQLFMEKRKESPNDRDDSYDQRRDWVIDAFSGVTEPRQVGT
jgi:hypothetical protein